MPYRARWQGKADPPAALLALSMGAYKGTLEEAQAECLALMGVVVEECCDPSDGPPCPDCKAEAAGAAADRAYDVARDEAAMGGIELRQCSAIVRALDICLGLKP